MYWTNYIGLPSGGVSATSFGGGPVTPATPGIHGTRHTCTLTTNTLPLWGELLNRRWLGQLKSQGSRVTVIWVGSGCELSNLCRRNTLKKLVPETGSHKSSCARNLHRCWEITSFFWYMFLARNSTQLHSGTKIVRHATRTVQRDWPACCFARRNCDKFATNFSCKFLVQDSGTNFWCKFL